MLQENKVPSSSTFLLRSVIGEDVAAWQVFSEGQSGQEVRLLFWGLGFSWR